MRPTIAVGPARALDGRFHPVLAFVLAVALAVALALAVPAVAEAKPCGDVRAQGKTWIVGGSAKPSCRFMRSSARRYLNRGREPGGWNCSGRNRNSGGCEKRRGDRFFIFYPPH